MSFSGLGVGQSVDTTLAGLGITVPTAVQRLVIPALIGGSSATVVARTGSGKTLAYAIPLLTRVATWELEQGPVTRHGRPRGLVLTSTRELVTQTTRVLKQVAHQPKLRVRGLSGGMTPPELSRALATPVDVVVANPSRVLSLCAEALAGRDSRFSLDDLRIVVVDEADTLLAPGTRPEIEGLLVSLPPQVQLIFISATLPEPIRHFVSTHSTRPILLLAKDAHTAPERVTVKNLDVPRRGRPESLEPQRLDTLDDVLAKTKGRGMVFANRRESAEALGVALRERGFEVAVMEGAMAPTERRKVFRNFCAGTPRILVTTELGGRGIDVGDLEFVVNFELPPRVSEYLHRVGRVGRQGRVGHVFNLVGPEDAAFLAEIKRLSRGGKLDTGEAQRGARQRKPKAQMAAEAALRAARQSRPAPAARDTRPSRPAQGGRDAAPEQPRGGAPGGRRGRNRNQG